VTSNIQVSGKANNGIIFVVGGDSYDDFYTNLLAVNDSDEARTTSTVAQLRELVNVGGAQAPAQSLQQAEQVVAQSFPQAQPVQQQYQQPAQPQQFAPAQAAPAAPGPAPLCPGHGLPAVFKTGTTKSGRNAGKTWRAWMCPNEKGNTCEAQWLRD
jgi:hypothetical protein